MGNTAKYVSTGKPKISGAVFRAPLGTTLPTDATSELDEAYVCLGFVSEDGVENANDLDVSEIKAWGGLVVYRSLNGLNDTFALALIESENPDVLRAVYGTDNVETNGSGDTVVHIKAEDPEEAVWIIELALRNKKAKRIVITDGAITARESITYNDSDAIAYGITISAYPDENNETHFELLEGDAPSI